MCIRDRLTTIVQDGVAKGAAVAAALRAAFAGEDFAPVELSCALRVGTTTGPAPA